MYGFVVEDSDINDFVNWKLMCVKVFDGFMDLKIGMLFCYSNCLG